LHLKDKPALTPGSTVSPDQQIASIGGSYGYDPHLHFDFLTRDNAFQRSTLAYMLGSDFENNIVNSKMPIWWKNVYAINRTYDPEKYYKNTFNYAFRRK
jgi:murein DD-endopeptidase MepM/ murein hydrolase activator NlpD